MLIKKYLGVGILAIMMAIPAFGQQAVVNQEIMSKSQGTRKAGYFVLAGGLAIATIGTIDLTSKQFPVDDDVPYALIAGGLVIAMCSLPFFLVAQSQFEKANRVTFGAPVHSIPLSPVVLPAMVIRIGPR